MGLKRKGADCMDEMQKKIGKRERFNRSGGAVTRIEFYGCFLVLVFLLVWHGKIANYLFGRACG